MQHNYGLDKIMGSGVIGVKSPFKKVILVNPEDAREKITVSGICRRLMGLGKFEWEEAEAVFLVRAILDAFEAKATVADISVMFSGDLIRVDRIGTERVYQENVAKFLIERLFEKVYEDENELRLKLVYIA